MNYKKPALWLVILSMLLSVVLAGCFLTDPVKEQLQEEPSVSREDQEAMDALLDQIYTKLWDTSFTWLHPDSYRLIHPEARKELMDYGDMALQYFTNKLRATTSDEHSAREQIMVYICEDLAKAIPAEDRYSEGWQTVPGMWLTYYDMKSADQHDKSGLQPGFYEISSVLYGDMAGTEAVYWDYGRTYMVTKSGMFVYETQVHYQYITSFTNDNGAVVAFGGNEGSGIRIKANEDHYANVYQVDWNWRESGRKDDLWSKLNGGEHEEYMQYNGFKDLLAEKDYRYQPLDDDHCLIQTGTGLYTDVYLIGQSNGQLEYVYQLAKISAT